MIARLHRIGGREFGLLDRIQMKQGKVDPAGLGLSPTERSEEEEIAVV
jgi:hypothetical protein